MSDANMKPDASPGGRAKNSGVRRANNVPLYIVGAVIMSFLIIIALVATDRAAQQEVKVEEDKKRGGDTDVFANSLTSKFTNGIIPAALPPVVVVEEDKLVPTLMVTKPDNQDLPPLPPAVLTHVEPRLVTPVRDEEAERIRGLKLQMIQEAAKAKTSVQIEMPKRFGASTATATRQEMFDSIAAERKQIETRHSNDPTAAYNARAAQIRKAMGAQETAPVQNTDSAFIKVAATPAKNNKWHLLNQVENPNSPYELRAGFVIPGILISGINSELPGKISAQVSQNVYDTATGRHLLVPLGTRLDGEYSSDVSYGQARVLVAWNRLIFPDGKALDIGSMPGSDGAGYAGFQDRVNNHYLRTFGSALLMSGVTAGFSLSQGESDSDNQRAGDSLSEALGQQFGQVTGKLIQKNMNIAPTLEVRPGFRFNVIVTKDITFSKPYQSFDY